MPEKDPITWQAVAAYLGAALASVTAWAWRHTHTLVKDKADAADVVLLAAALKEKADDKRVSEVVSHLDRVFENQRQDNQRIFCEIAKVAESHNEFTQKVIAAIGERPTRDECRQMWGKDK